MPAAEGFSIRNLFFHLRPPGFLEADLWHRCSDVLIPRSTLHNGAADERDVRFVQLDSMQIGALLQPSSRAVILVQPLNRSPAQSKTSPCREAPDIPSRKPSEDRCRSLSIEHTEIHPAGSADFRTIQKHYPTHISPK